MTERSVQQRQLITDALARLENLTTLTAELRDILQVVAAGDIHLACRRTIERDLAYAEQVVAAAVASVARAAGLGHTEGCG